MADMAFTNGNKIMSRQRSRWLLPAHTSIDSYYGCTQDYMGVWHRHEYKQVTS